MKNFIPFNTVIGKTVDNNLGGFGIRERFCNDIFINNNDIFMEGSCRYLYGIDAFKTWGSEIRNTNINIFENYVKLDGGSRMAEGIYVALTTTIMGLLVAIVLLPTYTYCN